MEDDLQKKWKTPSNKKLKWKTTSIFCLKNQNDDLKTNGRRPKKKNGRRPQTKWKTNKMEDDLKKIKMEDDLKKMEDDLKHN